MKSLRLLLALLALSGGVVAGSVGLAQGSSTQMQPQIININTATKAQLEALPGIGPKIAAEIIKNRPYSSSTELMDKVKGIGPKTWDDIKKYVRFR